MPEGGTVVRSPFVPTLVGLLQAAETMVGGRDGRKEDLWTAEWDVEAGGFLGGDMGYLFCVSCASVLTELVQGAHQSEPAIELRADRL